MKTVFKTALIIILSIVAGGMTIGAIEMISHNLYPAPTGIDFKDPEQLKSYVSELPLGAKLWVLAAWVVGMSVAAGLALFLSGKQLLPATVAILMLLGATCMNFFAIPHPIWMIFSAFLVAILVWLGAKQVASP